MSLMGVFGIVRIGSVRAGIIRIGRITVLCRGGVCGIGSICLGRRFGRVLLSGILICSDSSILGCNLSSGGIFYVGSSFLRFVGIRRVIIGRLRHLGCGFVNGGVRIAIGRWKFVGICIGIGVLSIISRRELISASLCALSIFGVFGIFGIARSIFSFALCTTLLSLALLFLLRLEDVLGGHNARALHLLIVQDLQIIVDERVVGNFLIIGIRVLVLERLDRVFQVLGFLLATSLLQQVLLSLQSTHTVRARKSARTRQTADDLDGLVPLAEIAQRTGIHDEHLCLGIGDEVLGILAHRQFDGLLRMTQGTFAISHERQIIRVTVHAIGSAEFAQGRLILTHAVCHQGIRFTGEIHTGRLVGSPLGVFKSELGVGFHEGIRSEDVQADVLGMFLRQAAQTLALVLRQHVPHHAFRHLRLTGTRSLVRVLRRIRHAAIGIATAETVVGIRIATIAVLALEVTAVAASLLVGVTVRTLAAVVAAEATTAVITTVIAMEVTAALVEIATVTAVVAAETTATVIPAIITAEVTTGILRIPRISALSAVAALIVATVITAVIAAETTAAIIPAIITVAERATAIEITTTAAAAIIAVETAAVVAVEVATPLAIPAVVAAVAAEAFGTVIAMEITPVVITAETTPATIATVGTATELAAATAEPILVEVATGMEVPAFATLGTFALAFACAIGTGIIEAARTILAIAIGLMETAAATAISTTAAVEASTATTVVAAAATAAAALMESTAACPAVAVFTIAAIIAVFAHKILLSCRQIACSLCMNCCCTGLCPSPSWNVRKPGCLDTQGFQTQRHLESIWQSFDMP